MGRQLAVGAIIADATGRLLLVRRGRAPARGLWSVPGGRVEPGEGLAEALVREVLEETGLHIAPVREVGIVERDAPGGGTFVIHDWTATVLRGEARAGDDATDLAWVSRAQLLEWDRAGRVVPGLVAALTAWEVLPTA